MTPRDLKVPPLLVAALTALAMLVLSRVAPGLAHDWPWRLAGGLSLIVVGGAVALAGVVEFRRRRTTVNPMTPGAASTIVTSGVYRQSRNPMYLGFLFALAGLATYLSNAASVLMIAAYVAYMNRYQIEPEERALLEKFGPEYAAYMARVRRWL
jgi:protein-S-isoprenylcysteine O-methyltransferase Ste14